MSVELSVSGIGRWIYPFCHIGGHQRKLEPLRIMKLYLCQISGTIDCQPKYDRYIAIQPCCCAIRKRIKEKKNILAAVSF